MNLGFGAGLRGVLIMHQCLRKYQTTEHSFQVPSVQQYILKLALVFARLPILIHNLGARYLEWGGG
jgi:hypothetical protein